MVEGELKISFAHELYSEKTKVVHYKQPWVSGSRTLYRNRICVKGNNEDIDKIREVKYILHPTFPNPIRTVTNTKRDKEFELIFWAWGEFKMHIIVTAIAGKVYDYTVPIRLHDILREAKEDKSVKWKDELAEQYLL